MVQLWTGIVANQKKCKKTIVTALIILHFVCNSIIFDWEVIKSKKFLHVYTKKERVEFRTKFKDTGHAGNTATYMQSDKKIVWAS